MRIIMKDRTLEDLDNSRWNETELQSHLVTECHRLRKKPIGEFSIENLRIMLGQNIGTKYLLPIALEVLSQDPLAEGDYYPGDLLSSVLNLPNGVWLREKKLLKEVMSVLELISEVPEEIEDDVGLFKTRHA